MLEHNELPKPCNLWLNCIIQLLCFKNSNLEWRKVSVLTENKNKITFEERSMVVKTVPERHCQDERTRKRALSGQETLDHWRSEGVREPWTKNWNLWFTLCHQKGEKLAPDVWHQLSNMEREVCWCGAVLLEPVFCTEWDAAWPKKLPHHSAAAFPLVCAWSDAHFTR